MAWSSSGRLAALAASLAVVARGQQSGWQENQINATMCNWKAPRVATLRDTVYIDGGYLYWTPGMADGSYSEVTQDNNPLGLVYSWNFSKPFNSSTNISDIMTTISKVSTGTNANNIAPNYYDGAMLANDDEFFLYGGLLRKTDTYTDPESYSVMEYQGYQYGAEKDSWRSGFETFRLPTNVTRYLAYGGGVSAPSENLAWYFSGMHSPSWGEIYAPTSNISLNAVNLSSTLITLDMSTQTDETWTNTTLPPDVKPRANAEVVWVPVGEKGILVSLGGVVYPDYNTVFTESENEAQSLQDSPKFMSEIDIFDIAGNVWYKQPTIAGPGQLVLGCAVVAVAQDTTSYNIYYYGGYDGLHEDQDFNDDVWILSLPSFMWMKISSGSSDHARAAHKCFTPYPDQMVVLGGYTPQKTNTINCVDGGILQVFNLTEGKWMDSYDPANWNEYGVPEMIYLMIGGTETGGATMTTPTPTGWSNTDLAKVFETKYPSTKIATWYPYNAYNSSSNATTTETPSSNKLASWVAPVLGVVLGLVFISAIVVGVLLYRRRKYLKAGYSDGDENRSRIRAWISGQDPHKAPTVTTESAPTNTDDMESTVGAAAVTTAAYHDHVPEMTQTRPQYMQQQYTEMPDTPLVELPDTSPPLELSDTPLTPVEIIRKHTHVGRAAGGNSAPTSNYPSSFSYTASHDHVSTVSDNSASRGFSTPQFNDERAESPAVPLGAGTAIAEMAENSATNQGSNPDQQQNQAQAQTSGAAGDPRVVSGLSNISRGHQAHLRNLSNMSDATVSSASEMGAEDRNTAAQRAPTPLEPIIDDGSYNNNASASNSSFHTPQPPPTNISMPDPSTFTNISLPGFSANGTPPGPVSPPTGDDRGGGAVDYLSYQPAPAGSPPTSTLAAIAGGHNAGQSRQQQSPLRRSAFRESSEDLGENRGAGAGGERS